MRENRLKKMLRNGETAIGMGVFFGTPTVVEILGHAGWDWVYIDTQHNEIGPFDAFLLENMVRAAEISGVTPLIRVAENDFTMIGKALDTGAQGVVIPLVNNEEEAIKAVKAAMYPPEGNRSVCPYIRANEWSSRDIDKYCRKANQEIFIDVLVETEEGIRNIEEIASVKGVDSITLGIVDLSLSMGMLGQVDQSDVLKELENTVEICRQKGVAVGTTVSPILTIEWATKLINKGVKKLNYSCDEGVFTNNVKEIIKRMRLKVATVKLKKE